MGKKKNKNKKKKVNAKRERYSKFRKEKPTNMTYTTPDVTPEQQKNRQEDEKHIEWFLKTNRNPPTKENNLRRMLSKR